MANDSSSDGKRHQQTLKQRPTDSIQLGLQDEIMTADQADAAAAKTKALTELNRSILLDLEEIVRDNPIVDLWLNLRDASRKYKVERERYIERPRSQDEEPVSSTESRPKHLLPTHGNVTVAWPLAPCLFKLLQFHLPSASDHSPDTQQPPISRSTVLDLIQRGEWISQEYQKAVVRIAPDIVVKICKNDDTVKLSNLQHIRTFSGTIPVPAPLGMLQIAQHSYIFTTFIEGTSLDRIWTSLEPWRKAEIQQQLDTIFTELRNLPLPSESGFLGGGNPPFCLDRRRWMRKSSNPIDTEARFNDFLLSNAHVSPRLVELIRPCLRDDHRIVMTHGDLHARNIIVNDSPDLRITGIIDWETAGGYPEYWEYIKALQIPFIGEQSDWDLFLPTLAIGTFPDEYIRDRMVNYMVN